RSRRGRGLRLRAGRHREPGTGARRGARLDREPVLRARLGLLPRRGARPGRPRARLARGPGGLAHRHGPGGHRRAGPLRQPARGQSHRPALDRAPAAGAHAGGRRAARGQARRGRVRLGAGIAPRADAPADPGHSPAGLRAGRRLRAPLRLPHEGRAAARRGGPGGRFATGGLSPGRDDHHPRRARGNAPRAGAAHGPGGCRAACRARLVQSRRHLSVPRGHGDPARRRGGPLLSRRPALPAALPAVLARQPGRPDVGGARGDRRGADPAVAPGAAALPVPRAFTGVPLVWAAARDRGGRGRARTGAPAGRGRAPGRAARPARRPRRAHRGTLVPRRGTVCSALAHRAGTPAAGIGGGGRARRHDMNLELEGAVTLVAGASKGIGLACARAFAAAGAKVVGVARNARVLEDAATELRREGLEIAIEPADVGDEQAVLTLVDRVEEVHGPISVLVNSAGAAKRYAPEELCGAAFRQGMDAKYFTTMYLLDAVVRRMASRGRGSVVNIIGQGGRRATPHHIPGGAANAALMLATVGYANAYAAHGVRVNAINPGLTLTTRLEEGL